MVISAARHTSPMSSFSTFTCRFSCFLFLHPHFALPTPPAAEPCGSISGGVSICLATYRNAAQMTVIYHIRMIGHNHSERMGSFRYENHSEIFHSEVYIIFFGCNSVRSFSILLWEVENKGLIQIKDCPSTTLHHRALDKPTVQCQMSAKTDCLLIGFGIDFVITTKIF